ncbi:hypothetical protein CJF30_00005692 [Rutstroemia sp. NJR-2017a BBW]|nr:hypothetical protein CJF30_00005692 [Rutstroemia sp. NJR-2017a BBW]
MIQPIFPPAVQTITMASRLNARIPRQIMWQTIHRMSIRHQLHLRKLREKGIS